MKSTALRVATAHFLSRAGVCLLGLGAVAWGGLALPLFWQRAPVSRVVSGILQGHTYKMQWLLDEAQKADAVGSSSFCNPAALHNAVVLRLVILDEAIATTNQAAVDSAYGTLDHRTRRALACTPADAFGWLTLFRLDVAKRGLQVENASYLRLSYILGANESWIALWRNKLAFSLFERLPTDLSDDALDEFIKLLETGHLYSEVATIFAAATPAVQSRIVARLKATKAIHRNMFARAVDDLDLDANILHAEGLNSRPPWRR